jgi:acyl-coenzyme A thioesterase PaaI-like protein
VSLVSIIERAKATGEFSVFANAIPYARFLGIGADCSTGEMIGKLTFAEHLVGNPVLPALHGGTIGALLETTAIFELLWRAESVFLPKTINVTIEYLRSGRATDTFANGVVTRHGRRVASVHVQAWQDDRNSPIATAAAHFLIVPPDEPHAGGN